MLTFDQIKEYFPEELKKLNPKGMLVEYLQYEFLDSLFKEAGSEKLSFIGGTAIRIIYNSQRFSEDLDFDNYGLGYGEFKALLEKTCRQMEIKGFELEYKVLKKEAVFHSYIKFPSILRQFGITSHHLEKIFLAMDAQQKEKISVPEVKPLNKFGIYRNIIANKADVLLSQKLLAILFRKRERGRDFYDVSFLGGLAKPDFEYIKKTAGMDKVEFKQKFLLRCSRFNFKALAKDVLPFLFNSEQKNRVLDFSRNIENILQKS